MVDVARLVGVSHQTVSRVINAHPNVRPETRARVLAAMRQLAYLPNSAARVLVTGRSRTIGVVCYNTALFGPAAALLGLERAARAAGYFVTIAGLRAPDPQSVADAVDHLRRQGVAGIVIIAPQAALGTAFPGLPKDRPIVALWGPRNKGISVIAAAEAAGAALATRHLLALGHPMVWHVSGPTGRLGTGQRLRGWRAALRAAGLPPPPPVIGDWSARSGYEAGRKLAADPKVSAIFAASDQMALGVLHALHEAGRQVPAEVSVIGFDDLPEAAFYTPPLSTVRQDFTALGEQSIARLIALIAEGNETRFRHVTLPTELVLRRSTAAPPGR